jgi:hypothetical protein
MNRLTSKAIRVVMATASFAVAGASVARANAGEIVVAKVPFAFIVGEVRLPAGDYIVKEEANDPGIVSIASKDGRQAVYTLTVPQASGAREAQPLLVFEKFDNQYFFERLVSADGNDREIVLTPATMERELAEIEQHPHVLPQ